MEAKKIENKCPFTEAMALLSGKWTLSIVNTLMTGTMRFSELERAVSGINTRMLARELKALEANRVVVRTVHATVPPTVEYTLTEKGRSLGKGCSLRYSAYKGLAVARTQVFARRA